MLKVKAKHMLSVNSHHDLEQVTGQFYVSNIIQLLNYFGLIHNEPRHKETARVRTLPTAAGGQ